MKNIFKTINSVRSNKKTATEGFILIAAINAANILSYLFNAQLGRTMTFEDYAVISFISNLYSILSIPATAMGTTINQKTSHLFGEGKDSASITFWRSMRKKFLAISVCALACWIVLLPFLSSYFKISPLYLLFSFAPIILVTFAAAADRGFMYGRLMFAGVAGVYLIEPLLKFLMAFFLVKVDRAEYIFLSIPAAAVAAFLLGWFIIHRYKNGAVKKAQSFPAKFFLVSLIAGISSVSFLSIDVIMAKHFLTLEDAGKYGLISLVGKMVFFLGSLSSPFIMPVVSRLNGAKKSTSFVFYTIFTGTLFLSLLGFLTFGLFGNVTLPILLGKKAYTILPYIPFYTFSMLCFTVSQVFTTFYLAKKDYWFSSFGLLVALGQVIGISLFHNSIADMVRVMTVLGISNIVLFGLIHVFYSQFTTITLNFRDFIELFLPVGNGRKTRGIKVLIFNWRDTKHMWAGGAETYVHEISKRWKKQGNSVTLFCGNDRKNPRNQTINGVKIIRRGGFYTVYLWALLYYVFRFRKNYDVIIDSENGIPFFTPLFSTKPVILLIHHVHQEVFIEYMKFPFSYIGRFIEGKIMPFVYKNHTVITVSQSSKDEIVNFGIAKEKNIHIVNPGVQFYRHRKVKTKNPSFVYLGRLKPYKNIDTAIKAFSIVNKIYKNSQLFVVGDGESRLELENLTKRLGLEKKVTFFGKVSEKEKIKILAKSWIAIQPSTVEGWGITVIEANMCGVPVVATDTNGLRDSIVNGKTGVLFKLRSSRELANIILRLTKKRNERKLMSQQAVIWSKQFEWDNSSDRFLSIIHNEIANKKSFLPVRTLSYLFNRVESIF